VSRGYKDRAASLRFGEERGEVLALSAIPSMMFVLFVSFFRNAPGVVAHHRSVRPEEATGRLEG